MNRIPDGKVTLDVTLEAFCAYAHAVRLPADVVADLNLGFGAVINEGRIAVMLFNKGDRVRFARKRDADAFMLAHPNVFEIVHQVPR